MYQRVALGVLAVGVSVPFLLGAACVGTGNPSTCDGTTIADTLQPSGISLSVEPILVPAYGPTAIAFAPDGRLFYTEKETGRVRIIAPTGELLDEPFVDVDVVYNSERGLLGIALHPNFSENGYVYIFYTRSTTGGDTSNGNLVQDNRVVRFVANGDVAEGDETLIISLPVTPGPNHDGGNIHFGPDGKLYVTLGDLAVRDNSQNIDVLPGKILRLNDDGSLPADNPFGNNNYTYALGLRNSFDFTFDPVTGTIFATENGTNLHDEINRLPAGANGGWPLVEGCADSTPAIAIGTYAQPLAQSDGSVVPTGIVFVETNRYGPTAENQLLVAESATGRILLYTLNDDRTAFTNVTVFLDLNSTGLNVGGFTDLAFAPDGTLYASTLTQDFPAARGSILRISPD